MNGDDSGEADCPHSSTEPEDHWCTRCDADRCPVCGVWFADYDALLTHLDDT